jgi:superfamily II DNA/RNA helicase
VLDEADRMVDIGFINEIKFFISKLPEQRQSLFFSATVSIKVTDIINTFVKNAITVSVKSRETSSNVVQELVRIRDAKKVDVLHDLLIKPEVSKTLIFGRTKHGVEKLSKELINRGFSAAAIHGDKRQSQRQSIIKRFKNNEIKVLLATDVASRGLDINNVTHVINYDLPETYEDYVHRIGRTGRGSQTGTAYTLVEE